MEMGFVTPLNERDSLDAGGETETAMQRGEERRNKKALSVSACSCFSPSL